MLVLVPVVTLLLIFQAIRRRGWEWRMAALGAAVAGGVCVWGITEGLSAFGTLSKVGSVSCWVAVALAALLWLGLEKEGKKEAAESDRNEVDGGLRALIAAALVMCVLILTTALVCPPNTWDAMVYHMPRAVMWMSNHRVDFYPTPDYQQLVFAPWAEYAMTQTLLLSGGDWFANLVEYGSYLGCALAASLIAWRLGAGRRGQIFAAVLSLTVPSLLLEASGPMNTGVATFWIATSVAFLLAWNESQKLSYIVCAGAAAGLAILTKGIAYLFLPWIWLACWWMAGRAAKVKFLKWAWIVVAAVLVLNGAQYARCYRLTGSVLGMPLPDYTPRLELTIKHLSVQGTLANVIRNVSVHFGTPSEPMNGKIEKVFRKGIRMVGADPDDPEQVWLGGEAGAGLRFEQEHFSVHEVHAGNPLHVVLVALAFVIVVGTAWRSGRWIPVWYASGIALGFLYFCASLRWHFWMARLQLPAFVLGAALVGYVLERNFSRRAANAVAAVLLTLGLLFAATNRIRSLVRWSKVNDVYRPRGERYFLDEHKDFAAQNIAAAQRVNSSGCNRVAVDTYQADDAIRRTPAAFFVYPILALIHANGGGRQVWYGGVHNATERYEAELRHPPACAVICMECAGIAQKATEYGLAGGTTEQYGRIVVFLMPKGSP